MNKLEFLQTITNRDDRSLNRLLSGPLNRLCEEFDSIRRGTIDFVQNQTVWFVALNGFFFFF